MAALMLLFAGLVSMIMRLEKFPAYNTNTEFNAVIADKKLTLQIADSDSERAKGLSGQPGLASHEGMLFVFDHPGIECFWMKDMKFGLDILWFDANNRLIHLERDVQPASYPKNYCPPTYAKYVVETNAGKSEEFGWKLGDKLELEKQ